ncbi:MAG: hypothetical protein HND58_03180 [Planctomycetota bacterium]|nr:MAG: hypothetical protein HND58_03180 [Planctomycetota bacterium]
MIRTAIRSLPVLLLASAGLAQTQWNNAAGGAWNLPSNWDTSDVPDMPDESASIDLAGTYTVVLSSLDPSILALLITNPNATLGINGGETLSLGAGLLNDGLIVVDFNSSSAATAIDFLTDTTIDGAGLITLNQTFDRAQILSSTGAIVTNGANHTIDGRGRLRAAMINDGLISANWSGSTLELRDTDKTNNGLMEAANGGILELVSVAVDQSPGGVVRADGSTVRVSSSSVAAINDGTVETINDGLVLVLSGGELTLHDVSLSGALDINGGGAVRVTGSALSSDALIRIDANSSSATGVLEFTDSIDLSGTGTIQMVQTVFRSQLNTGDGATLTHGANHTIRGRGWISAALVNNGSVIADVPGSTLELRDTDKTNNAMIQALDGGILELVSVAVDQSPDGVVRADGATVRVSSSSVAAINDGTVETINDGLVLVLSGGELTLHDVSLSGALDINGGGAVRVTGSTLANDALIRIDANSSSATGVLEFTESIDLSGTGTIQMVQTVFRSQLNTGDGATLTHGADHTIRGRGWISAALVNNGSVIADVPGSTLELRDTDKTNNAMIQALDGGILQLVDGVLTQVGAGAIVADAGTVFIDGGGTPTIVGGSLEAMNGGTVEVSSGGELSLDSVQNESAIRVDGGGAVRSIGGGFTNNGVLEINANNSSATSLLVFGASGRIGGTGEISLPRVTTRSTLTTEDGVVGTVGSGQRVTGIGQLDGDLRMEGTVAPGSAGIGSMRLTGNLEMHPGSSLEIEFNSLSQFDDLEGPGTFSAGGTLAATNTSGGAFDPAFGDSFVVVDAAGGITDQFDAVTGPALPGVLEWRVRYDPTQAVLIVSCDGDANLDGVINTLDVLGFLNLWTAGDPKADINGDGDVNTLDVLAFLNAWTAGC